MNCEVTAAATAASCSGGTSEFSDSSSSISIDELPSSTWAPLGTATITAAAGGACAARKLGANRLIFTTNDATMMTLMEASDCDDLTSTNAAKRGYVWLDFFLLSCYVMAFKEIVTQ